jgi:hypothetical protein
MFGLFKSEGIFLLAPSNSSAFGTFVIIKNEFVEASTLYKNVFLCPTLNSDNDFFS